MISVAKKGTLNDRILFYNQSFNESEKGGFLTESLKIPNCKVV